MQSAAKNGVDEEFENLTLTEKLGRHQSDKFQQLKQNLIEEGKLYEDPDFPADGELKAIPFLSTCLKMAL